MIFTHRRCKMQSHHSNNKVNSWAESKLQLWQKGTLHFSFSTCCLERNVKISACKGKQVLSVYCCKSWKLSFAESKHHWDLYQISNYLRTHTPPPQNGLTDQNTFDWSSIGNNLVLLAWNQFLALPDSESPLSYFGVVLFQEYWNRLQKHSSSVGQTSCWSSSAKVQFFILLNSYNCQKVCNLNLYFSLLL